MKDSLKDIKHPLKYLLRRGFYLKITIATMITKKALETHEKSLERKNIILL